MISKKSMATKVYDLEERTQKFAIAVNIALQKLKCPSIIETTLNR